MPCFPLSTGGWPVLNGLVEMLLFFLSRVRHPATFYPHDSAPPPPCGHGAGVRRQDETANVCEVEVADGLVAFDARCDDFAGDEDELRADGEREFLTAAEEQAHAAANERQGAAVPLGEAGEDGAQAQGLDPPPAAAGIDGDAAAVFVVDGQDGGDVLVRCQYICVVLLHGVASFMLNSIFLYRYYIIFIFHLQSFPLPYRKCLLPKGVQQGEGGTSYVPVRNWKSLEKMRRRGFAVRARWHSRAADILPHPRSALQASFPGLPLRLRQGDCQTLLSIG